jgi:hypothetical protein
MDPAAVLFRRRVRIRHPVRADILVAKRAAVADGVMTEIYKTWCWKSLFIYFPVQMPHIPLN